MVLPEELGASADGPLERVAAEIYAGLGPALRQANAMDFDDLLLFPLTLFAEHPSVSHTGSAVSITCWWTNSRIPTPPSTGS